MSLSISYITALSGFLRISEKEIEAVNMITYRAGILLPKMPKATGFIHKAIFAWYFASDLQVARFSTMQRNPSCSRFISPAPSWLFPGQAVLSWAQLGWCSLRSQWGGSGKCPL